jgi:single-strand DNA-binding protein
MASFNKVIIMGNISNEVELKQTQGGTSVCSFNIAVNRNFGRLDEKKVDFFTVVAWGPKAEFVSRYFKKGQAIVVCGRLENREWQDKNGNKRISTEIIAEEISFAGGKENSTEAKNEAPTQPYIPAAYSTENSQDFEEILGDETLPF